MMYTVRLRHVLMLRGMQTEQIHGSALNYRNQLLSMQSLC